MARLPRILFIDDEANLRRVVAAGLGPFGFEVDTACDIDEALGRIAARRPDAIVLDINLPRIDGVTGLPAIRQRSDAPIVMLTARGELDDKVAALARGADDYLTKPFEMRELAARLGAHLRRRTGVATTLVFDDLVVDLERCEATRGGARLPLSPTEFDLLAVLITDQGRVFRKSQLLQAVWGSTSPVGIETVDRFVSLLRQKLENDGASRLVQTVRGVGYALREASR